MNRYFLAIGILCSVILPSLHFRGIIEIQPSRRIVESVHPIFFNNTQPAVIQVTPFQTASAQDDSLLESVEYWQLAGWIILAGMMLMGIRLLMQMISLYRIHKRSVPTELSGLPFRALKDMVSPFSFWKSVYLNPAVHSEEEISGIIAHENIHIRQLHTLDVLLAELIVMFLWFNPAAWLLKGFIKENLEFITDQQIISNGADIKQYQYSLLLANNLQQSNNIVNNFNFLTLKKRIIMMNRTKSSRKLLLSYAAVLPVLMLAPFLVSVSQAQSVKVFSTSARGHVAINSTGTESTAGAAQSGPQRAFKKDEGVKGVDGEARSIVVASAQESHTEFFTEKKPYETVPDTVGGAPMILVDGKESSWNDFAAIPSKDISSISTFKGATTVPQNKEKLKNGLMIVTTRNAGTGRGTQWNEVSEQGNVKTVKSYQSNEFTIVPESIPTDVQNNVMPVQNSSTHNTGTSSIKTFRASQDDNNNGNKQVFRTINRNADVIDTVHRSNSINYTAKPKQ